MKTPHAAPIVGGVVATIVVLAHAWWTIDWTVDDVFITLRYAKNLAEGLGPVYNAGEAVEGYTCPLWMLLLAGTHAVGLELYDAARALGLAFAIATIWLVAYAHRFDDQAFPPAAGCTAAILASTTLPFVQWAATGMETSLFACCTTWMVLAYLSHLRRPTLARALLVVVAAALCLLTRPDAVVFVAVLGIHRIAVDLRGGTRWSLLFLVALASVYLPYFAWRWSYYGHLLPNTFYAKVGSSDDQVVRGIGHVLAGVALSFVVIAPHFSWTLLRVHSSRALDLLLLLVAAQLAFIASVGGDHFPAFRFFVPIVPLAALGTGAVVVHALPALRRRIVVIAALLLVNVVSLRSHADYREIHDKKGWVARKGKLVGEWLRASVPPESVLATNAAGALAYYSELRVIDMLGLTDEHIGHAPAEKLGQGKPGHEKADGAYVLSRRPDYVMFGSSGGAEDPMFRSDRELDKAKGFDTLYVLEKFRVKGAGTVKIYRRRDAPKIDAP
jgi:arabinofuranosyltransferase